MIEPMNTTVRLPHLAAMSEPELVPPCQICGNHNGNKIHTVREMMLGLRDTFRYLECASCNCLQLLDRPEDMARYYPSDYPAFRSDEAKRPAVVQRFRSYLRERRNQAFVGHNGWFERLLTRRYDNLPLKAFGRLGASKRARIVDVGCGAGILLASLKELGYENLLGVDRFAPPSTGPETGVKIVRGDLGHLAGSTWDVMMFHHSFEHMPEPGAVLENVMTLLAPGGLCLIRIPVVGWAWQHYGVNWVQIDAPRHLFLHSVRSFQLLAERAGLKMREVIYDSDEFQFWVSELYARNVALASLGHGLKPKMFSKAELRRFRERANQLNAEKRGDSGVFILTKPS